MRGLAGIAQVSFKMWGQLQQRRDFSQAFWVQSFWGADTPRGCLCPPAQPGQTHQCGLGPCCSADSSAIHRLKFRNPLIFSQPNMREILFLILYKAKGDITEGERGWKVSLLSAWTDLFCTVFSALCLMVSWLFTATRQGRRDGNMFPAFGQECPRASQAWPRQCLFCFLYSWPRCWNSRLRPSWPVERLPLLVQHVMVPGIRLGTVPGAVFLSSRLFCPFAFQEIKTREKNPGRALPPSGAGAGDGSARAPTSACTQQHWEEKPFRQDGKPSQNRTKGKSGFGLLY